uniref:Retrotransposon protein, putative, Ty3-gypsy subclass n=2 Tax=Oryza sativa subsp. japonica TaxID=39947 RepID=Q53K46_ORYSJ|nr:retrotransposon protein, putative, Ty3-gypsy sub-class [Oryza sativa Japonica Group]ABA93189.1 retrotransposon protein, putative, Ty3-gypsy subclass [Oryza sativa Japonica Group]
MGSGSGERSPATASGGAGGGDDRHESGGARPKTTMHVRRAAALMGEREEKEERGIPHRRARRPVRRKKATVATGDAEARTGGGGTLRGSRDGLGVGLRGMDISPAREGDRVPVRFRRCEAVAEMTHVTMKLAAAARARGLRGRWVATWARRVDTEWARETRTATWERRFRRQRLELQLQQLEVGDDQQGSENSTKNLVNALGHGELKKNSTTLFPIINCIH